MGVGKKYFLKILIVRSWEGNLTQLSPPRKYSNHQKIPRCPRHPSFLPICCWPLEEHVALWTKETKAFCMQIVLRCRFTHLGPMLLAGSRGQHAQTTETLHHPTKTFRLLVQLRRGRHLHISRCKGTCFLRSLSKVSKSLLYTARVIIIAQKSSPYSSEFGPWNFCQEVQVPRWGPRYDRKGLEAGKEEALCSWGVIRDKKHTSRKDKGSLITSPIML